MIRLHTKKKLLGLLGAMARKLARIGAPGRAPSAHRLRSLAEQVTLLTRMAEGAPGGDVPARYGEIFRGMAQALAALPAAVSPEEAQETCRLLADLVQAVTQELRKEPVQLVFAFLPYKAAMWDSLESIWMAADRDPVCSPIVMSLPYADRDAEGRPVAWHDEIRDFPRYVPVRSSEGIELADLHPDAIFIHNPYDNYNAATSVDMKYYSENLKRWTDCLVYVPYYVTSGGMGEFQRSMASYANFDLIVAQSEVGIPFFDADVRPKILPLGSPKLDRVVRIASHPPKPPAGWRARMAGRTVYFFNTSLGGLTQDTERFYRKMEYVFSCFRGRKDACLLWRPHPLFWATLRSVRPEFVAKFEALRDAFVEDGLGIYDTTPDIEQTIALSDVYIGDAGTSVTALFGAAGKPVFILNNRIDTAPDEEDARSAFVNCPGGNATLDWMMLPDNSVWRRGADGVFHPYCRLSRYHAGGYYTGLVERGGKLYAIPSNGLSLLVVKDRRIVRSLDLRDDHMPYGGRFAGCLGDGADPENQRYLFLRPFRYTYLVRIDTQTDELTYIEGVSSMHAAPTEEDAYAYVIGGCAYLAHRLYFASPVSADILVIDDRTLARRTVAAGDPEGTNAMAYDATDGTIWLLPMKGYRVRRWNPATGEIRVYDASVPGLSCMHPRYDVACRAQAFCQAVFTEDHVLLTPLWGNKFVRLRKADGRAEEWTPPAELLAAPKNEYFFTGSKGVFLLKRDETHWLYYSWSARRLYNVDLAGRTCEEVAIPFDMEEVRRHAPGFCRVSEWLQYACEENALQSLPALLSGTLPGAPFDAEAERAAYAEVAANIGTCGEAVYAAVKERLLRENSQETK